MIIIESVDPMIMVTTNKTRNPVPFVNHSIGKNVNIGATRCTTTTLKSIFV